MSDESEIRVAVDRWASELPSRDLDALAERAPSARASDMESWFATWPGSAEREMRWLTIAPDGTAWCHALHRTASGVWVRATIGLRKLDGRWHVMREALQKLHRSDVPEAVAA
jgi:ketosteroid isomerase-like protein